MKTKINIDQFNSLVNMINSTDEDLNLAIENIKNLNLDEIYLKLILKKLNNEKRTLLFSSLKKNNIVKYTSINQSVGLDYCSLYNDIINNNANEYKDIFEYILSDHLLNLCQSNNWDFIKTININVK